jgi:CheY-like chemotaxis protein/DNA-directed RNA polymerase subunit RPC12/RpoP
MDVACSACRSKFKIPDEKIPKDQMIEFPCPRCREKISIDTRGTPPADPPAGRPQDSLLEEVSSGTYDASEKPFDFLEAGAKTALLCGEEGTRIKIRTALQRIGYHATEPGSAREALKQMRFHTFDLIVIDERFDTAGPDENHILRFLDKSSMSIRRQIFVVLLTERFRTNDNMAAFSKSVNLVVNAKNINEMETILRRGIAENEAFYRVFRETLSRTGKA